MRDSAPERQLYMTVVLRNISMSRNLIRKSRMAFSLHPFNSVIITNSLPNKFKRNLALHE